jgi:hypothetical protein
VHYSIQHPMRTGRNEQGTSWINTFILCLRWVSQALQTPPLPLGKQDIVQVWSNKKALQAALETTEASEPCIAPSVLSFQFSVLLSLPFQVYNKPTSKRLCGLESRRFLTSEGQWSADAVVSRRRCEPTPL